MFKDKVLIFDVDNTLYQAGDLVDRMEDVIIKKFFAIKLSVNENEAWQIIQDIRSRYHYDVDALEGEYPFSKYEFMETACRVDMSFLKPNYELNSFLHMLPQTKIIFTDNTVNHAKDVFNAIGVDENVFDDIFDAHAMKYTFKRKKEAFNMMLDRFKLKATSCIMFEDSITNLKMASNFGMTTVLISPDAAKIDENFNFKFKDINTALAQMFFAKS